MVWVLQIIDYIHIIDKVIEKLFNKPCDVSDFNDDLIGRALDELYANIAIHIVIKLRNY